MGYINRHYSDWSPVVRVDFDSCKPILERPTYAEQKIAERGICCDYADSTDSLEQRVVKQIVKEMEENTKGDPKFMPTRDMADAFRYMTMDCDQTYELWIKLQKEKDKGIYDSMIHKVIFNPPATIVIWKDGSKTVVKCGENDIFDPEKGLAMAISKRAFGDNRDYYEIFAKWVGKYEYQQKKKEKK